MAKYTTVEELRDAIRESHDSLSKRLKQVAIFALDNPNDMAFETLVAIAERAGVQASTIVRFAQHFGFSGASEMQRLFKGAVLSDTESLGYLERIRKFNASNADANDARDDYMVEEFTRGSVLALETLSRTIDRHDIKRAHDIIREADTIYIVAFRRVFSIASYMTYIFHRLGRKCILIDGVGGLQSGYLESIEPTDVIIAASYSPYASETLEFVEEASQKTENIISISDSTLSPISALSKVSFGVKEAEVANIKTVSASFVLAQVLAAGHAF